MSHGSKENTLDAERLTDLIKAVWAAGFRSGYGCGDECATALAWGEVSGSPSDPQKAWETDVQWRIETDTSYHVDITNPKRWEDIP